MRITMGQKHPVSISLGLHERKLLQAICAIESRNASEAVRELIRRHAEELHIYVQPLESTHGQPA